MTDLVKPNHKIIYLVPDDVDSWLWCDDPAPAPSMVEDEAIKYIRADQADKEIEQLKKDKDEAVFRLNDIKDMLMSRGVGDVRIYGCDEWSTPIANINSLINLLTKNKHANED